jgi:two-component system, LytTR family, response regulator
MKEDKITVMIVDDDIKSQQMLEYHLHSIPGIEILSIASSADEAYRFLLGKVPDLIFLDVEMPSKSGFDLVQDLHRLNLSPCIIFQTAFDKYAIEAIKHAAFDYLLKPIDREELLETLVKFRTFNEYNQFDNRVERLIRHLNPIRKIQLKSKNGFILVDPNEIYYCESDWNYSIIFYGLGCKETLCINLGKLLEMLPSLSFFRISRSVVINIKYLTRVSRDKNICTLQIQDREVNFHIPSKHIQEMEKWLG